MESQMTKEFSTLLEMGKAFPNEQSCINHLKAIRWKNGKFCPHCGSVRVYDFSDKRTHKCGDCRQRFSIKVGTIFEDTKLPLQKWFLAIWYITSHRKGVSSTQLARDIGVTQKSAWFMMHRLRHAARTRSFNRPLKGEIESDETFLGGKERNKHAKDRKHDGRGARGKTPIIGMMERGGELRTMKIQSLKADDMDALLAKHVQRGATLITDEFPGYNTVGGRYRHVTLNHSAGEYGRGRYHTNSIEGFWSQFKRKVYGIHHWISTKHTDRYLDEMTFKHNLKHLEESERFNALLGRLDGRLKYATLIAKT